MTQSSINTTMLDLIELLVVRSYPLYLSILKEPPNKNIRLKEDNIYIEFTKNNSILRIYYYQNDQYRKKYILDVTIDTSLLPSFRVIFGATKQIQYNLDIREILNITEEDKTMFYLQDESNLLKEKIEFSKDDLNLVFTNIKI